MGRMNKEKAMQNNSRNRPGGVMTAEEIDRLLAGHMKLPAHRVGFQGSNAQKSPPRRKMGAGVDRRPIKI